MRKSILPSIVGMVCILAFFLLSGVDCNDGEGPSPSEDECGELKNPNMDYSNDGAPDAIILDPAAHYNGGGGFVKYTYSTVASFDDVCKHKHIEVGLYLYINKDYINKVAIRADVLYGVFYNYPVENFNSTLMGEKYLVSTLVEFGIKPAVPGENPGWFRPFIEITFQNQGSAQDNHAFFLEAVQKVQISCFYYEYKAPPK